MDDGYRRCVLAQGMTTTGGPLPERSARIVFSPLHGVGEDAVVPVLEAAGWKLGESLFLVESQRRPDPRFRGAPGGIPNPEVPTSLEAGVALARRPDVRGDLVLATDPDADRLAIQVVSSERPGVPSFLMGGQLCAVLGAWVLSQLRAQGRLPADGVAVRNVVTSDLVQEIAESYGLAVEWNVPVGFKYVGKVSYDLRHTPERFVFGAEQSYGFLRGMHCRDKDGAVAALLAAELCDYLKRQEPTRTVLDWLADLWRDHAYYAERANPIRMEGITGLQRIREALRGLRLRFPTEIAGVRVVEVWDMLKDRIFDPASRNEESGDDWDDLQDPLEALYGDVRELGWGWLGENVLIARLATGERDWAAVRPSGTEPSLKIYVNVRRQGGDLLAVAREAEALADEIESALKERMGLT
jgi:phosphomannomutase